MNNYRWMGCICMGLSIHLHNLLSCSAFTKIAVPQEKSQQM